MSNLNARKTYFYLILCVVLSIPIQAFTQEINFPSTPLNVKQGVPPNIFFMVDDSGSMDYEISVLPHFEYCRYIITNKWDCSTTKHEDSQFHFSEEDSDDWDSRTFHYMFDKDNLYHENHTFLQAIEHSQLVDRDWRVFDSALNRIFYNPNQTYSPWQGPCKGDGTSGNPFFSCGQADFNAVRSHPVHGHTDYNNTWNLASHYVNGNQFYHRYAVSIDDRGFENTRPSHDDITSGANDMVDIWDSHAIITLLGNGVVNVKTFQTDVSTANTSQTNNATLSDTQCYNVLGPKSLVNQIINGSMNVDAVDGSGCRTITQVEQNYANWMQYYRRRDYAAKAALSEIVSKNPTFHYGLSYINSSSINIESPTASSDGIYNLREHNLDLMQAFLSEPTNFNMGTPLVQGLQTAGKYFKNEISGQNTPIKYECQLNNTFLITDGYYSTSGLPLLGDVDGDGYGATGSYLSDVARYYYENDLSGLANEVPTTDNNPNDKQHMVTYGISFGVPGKLEDSGDGWPNLGGILDISSDWGNPDCGVQDCPEKIDDLWHASFNSKGRFYNVSDTDEMIRSVNQALGNITIINNASLSSTTVQSGILKADNYIYQATFSNIDWNGNLRAFNIDEQGTLNTTPAWIASDQLEDQGHAQRRIYSNNGNQGVLFQWPNDSNNLQNTDLSQAQIDYLLTDFSDKSDSNGQLIVNFLRGDRSSEMENNGQFRDRIHMLGDIVHSSPIHIAPPDLNYPEASYQTFKNTYASRNEMVVAGANDGMLHVFDANTGNELMAYVPGHQSIYGNLHKLASPTYEHEFFVDAPAQYGDVYLDSRTTWRTIISGGFRSGAQGIYALDVTPGTFANTDAGAQETVLFEFTDLIDADVGNIIDKPQIVKMNNNKWAIVFGNGYNSTSSTYASGEADVNTSATGKAYLFVLFIDEGLDGTWTLDTDYIKIPVGADGQNGLSQPFPVDLDGDYKVDYFYAGDLNGSLWKFDVTSSNPADWKLNTSVHKIFQTDTSEGTGAQPIINTPVVGPHPYGLSQGVMVYIGTGKYLETADKSISGQATQAFYGIWDNNTNTTLSGYSNLLQQQIITSDENLRALTDNSIDWASHRGWYLKLEQPYSDGNGNMVVSNSGEKVVGQPILRNGRIIFTTVVPPDSSSICATEFGASWLMEVSAKDGSRLDTPPFDITKDGLFNEDDYIYYTVNGADVAAPHGGVKSDVGVMGGGPTILISPAQKKEIKILSGTGGLSTQDESPAKNMHGRQSWQEVQ